MFNFLNNHWILSIIWLFFLFLVIKNIVQNIYFDSIEIPFFKVVSLINSKTGILVDVRDKKQFLSGYIPGSINITESEIISGNIEKININFNFSIILVFEKNIKNNQCILQLEKLGYKKIYVLKGGINGWNENNLPLIV